MYIMLFLSLYTVVDEAERVGEVNINQIRETGMMPFFQSKKTCTEFTDRCIKCQDYQPIFYYTISIVLTCFVKKFE